MAQPSPAANTLYYGDNLDILRRYIDDESVDLIYLDPPFNSNADYNVLFAEKDGSQAHAQIMAFEDTWKWGLEAEQEYAEILRSGHDRVAKAVKGMRDFIGASDMLAYLVMMALRLIELRRVLKPTGSIYLHCDPTASHYLKLIMDAVFGPENFLNEIIWKRTGANNSAARYGPVHDVVLFYSKMNVYAWHPQYIVDQEYQDERYTYTDTEGRKFYPVTLHAAGTRNGSSGLPWRGIDITAKGGHWKYGVERLEELDKEGCIYWPERGTMPRLKMFLTDAKGAPIQDVWADITVLNSQAQERLGYPTQKPEALLERMLMSSSKEGDVVLDPFCGCGTTIAAAQRLNRRWIGIDITHLAVNLIKVRLADAFGPKIVESYKVIGEPEDLGSAKALADQDKYQFQYWALGLVGARPAPGQEKKGADKGIDGRIYMTDREGETKTIIISVKGGHATVSQIRDLGHVVTREDAAIGVFITLEDPTGPMKKEAAEAGFWQTKTLAGTKHPRLQILTIEDLLSSKRIDMPTQQDVRSFKQAPKAKSKKKADAGLF